MYQLIKPFLFLLSPEKAHRFTVTALEIILKTPLLNNFFKKQYQVKHPSLVRNVMGLTFQNPVGLAAGFDKDGKHYAAMHSLGFGFVEVGTVTPVAQDGNPTPRLFRLPDDHALINRMGFNNQGVDALAERLKQPRPEGLIIGGNIGKNKNTPNETATQDYIYGFEKLFDVVDYFVVNVSSPNTPDLRALQDKAPLLELLSTLQKLNQQKKLPKPILLKIAPDLTKEQLDDILDIIAQTNLTGIIATNTTISRANLKTDTAKITDIGMGGLSGAPVRARSTEVIRYLRQHGKKEMILIGVGGIETANDALEKLDAGANLVQIYTGLIYAGPDLVASINRKLVTA
jgi:dihydroorotate dehydrogenase